MTLSDHIPPEAVEAAARALCLNRGIDPDAEVPEEWNVDPEPRPYWKEFADEVRACLSAGLAAWKGMETLGNADMTKGVLILPLDPVTENENA